jgi:hypothetical protein
MDWTTIILAGFSFLTPVTLAWIALKQSQANQLAAVKVEAVRVAAVETASKVEAVRVAAAGAANLLKDDVQAIHVAVNCERDKMVAKIEALHAEILELSKRLAAKKPAN